MVGKSFNKLAALSLCAGLVLLGCRGYNRRFIIISDENGERDSIEVTGLTAGEDYLSIHDYYVQWEGQDSVRIRNTDEFFYLDGKVAGANLGKIDPSEITDTNDILTLQMVQPYYFSALSRFPNLRALSCYAINQNDLAALKDAAGIELLDVFGPGVSDSGLRYLSNFKNLRHLCLCENKVTDEGLRYLSDLKNLTSLDLEFTHCTDEGISYLKDLTSLRRLNLGLVHVSEKGLTHLSAMKNLRELHIWGQDISDEGLRYLADLPRLRKLSLQYTSITSRGISFLKDLKHLKELTLTFTPLVDENLAALHELTNIRVLRVGELDISPDDLEELRRTLPRCDIDYVGN
ncbi:hypothetical protein GF359_04460 [candidate division WOR-3 bacterium]|uniref:Leucine-rich repeat domain-containing protein n=1 Tax=candidate division WOR-3 bacterium TaxID=2052148 RepID=A0A9D5K976_UNCW3|nr:hypothetical protein [candidate division WOR-3 bacterium]MBD3364449.1 hypothetical protein [candidate division WOR-3 bacterium]